MDNGPLTWMMLHTFSVKIKPETYLDNKIEIINFIREIYINYPCSICKRESLNYLDKYDKSLDTQEDLKNYLYDFHLHINIKLYKKYYDKSILDKYNKTDTYTIFNLFLEKVNVNDKIINFFTTNKHWFN